jgi:uncharacterized OB-fold protein
MKAAREGGDKGNIIDFVPVLYPPENLMDLGQYVCALVRLDNGCRMFGIMLEKPENIKEGSRVVLSDFRKDDGGLFFKST